MPLIIRANAGEKVVIRFFHSLNRNLSMHIQGLSYDVQTSDYLYRSGSLKWDVESGMWGIFRVLRKDLFCKCKDMCHKILGKKFYKKS